MVIRATMLVLLVGLWMAGSAAGASAAAGRRPELDRWALGGFLWGIGLAVLILLDCARPWPAMAGRFGSLLYMGGVTGGLIGLLRQSRPSLRWLWTLLLTGLTFIPFFLLSVMNALCHFN
jgi:hypothetical protein